MKDMLSIEQRIPLFLIGCIGTRLLFSYVASFIQGLQALLFAILLGIMGLGFQVIYFGGLRKTGAEAGGIIWWNHMRPFHGIMYVISAFLLWLGMNSFSSNIILIDTIVGLIAFLHHHFIWI